MPKAKNTVLRVSEKTASKLVVVVEETKGRAFRGAGALQGRGDRGMGSRGEGPA